MGGASPPTQLVNKEEQMVCMLQNKEKQAPLLASDREEVIAYKSKTTRI